MRSSTAVRSQNRHLNTLTLSPPRTSHSSYNGSLTSSKAKGRDSSVRALLPGRPFDVLIGP